jgi:hypothetical protein
LVREAPAYRSRSSSGSRFTAVTFGLLLFNPVRAIVKLIAQHGHRGNMSKWVLDLRGDCPKRNAAQLHERCDLICHNRHMESQQERIAATLQFKLL